MYNYAGGILRMLYIKRVGGLSHARNVLHKNEASTNMPVNNGKKSGRLSTILRGERLSNEWGNQVKADYSDILMLEQVQADLDQAPEW